LQRHSNRNARPVPANEGVELHDGEHRPPVDEAGEQHERETGRVVGSARPRLAFDVERQLFAEEEVLGRQPRVGVQASSEELKEIEHHTADRAGHQ
jgi:hypothetical protein